MRDLRFGTLVAALLLASAAPAANRPAAELYEEFGTKKTDKAKAELLKAAAGSVLEGSGSLEGLTPRTFYDTSIPDADSTVALIQVAPDRKVVCGMTHAVFDTLGWLREGSPVAFSGRLTDAQRWENWTTLYLTQCELKRQ